jgi:hypothetical protein
VNVAELRRAIADAGAGMHFSARARADTSPGKPDNVTILEPSLDEPDRWVVYYTERGQVFDLHTFDSEDAACDYMYSILTKPASPITRGPMTAEEQQEAASQLRKAKQRARELLIAAGRDPETGQPV